MSMVRRVRVLAAAALFGAILAQPPLPVAAQGLVYHTRSRVEFGQGMGPMAGMMGGPQETAQIQYLRDGMLRTDSDDVSMILDSGSDRLIQLDHGDRTYAVTTVAELSARMEQMREMMQRMAPGTQQAGAEIAVTVEPTGESAQVNGFRAERLMVVVDMGLGGMMMGAMMGPDARNGRAVLVTDLWASGDVPGHETFEAFQRRQAEEFSAMAEAMSGGGMSGMMGSRSAFERVQEEMMKVDGMAVRTLTYMITLGEGQTPDLDALAAGDSPYLMKTVMELTEAAERPVQASMFEIPEGYRQVEFFEEGGR